MGFFSKYKQFVAILLVVIIGLTIAAPAFAQTSPLTGDSCKPFTRSFEILLCLSFLVNSVSSLVALLVTVVLVAITTILNISNYDSFIIVRAGWPIARDFVNLLFIVALMIMSFGTIFRIQKFAISSNLLTLIIFAGLVNFSLVLASLMVDVSQVVVKEFMRHVDPVLLVSTIKGLNLFDAYRFATPTGTTTTTPDDLKILASVVLALIIGWVAFKELLKLLKQILKRTVIFWVTLATSPVLFSVPMLPGGSKISGQWWSEFSKALAIGPATAFFLYLAVRTFNSPDVSNLISGILTNLFKQIGP